MKLKFLLTTMLVACASTMMAQTHGKDGYYNYTAKQMQADGVTCSAFSTGTKVDGWKNTFSYEGDYLKSVMGLGKDETEAVVYKNGTSSTDKSYHWYADFSWKPKETIKVTKNYPVIAWKFSLPVNTLDKAYSYMRCEHFYIHPTTGTSLLLGSQWGDYDTETKKYTGDQNTDWYYDPIKGLSGNGRASYWCKFLNEEVTSSDNSDELVQSMDYAHRGESNNSYYMDQLQSHANGFIYSTQTSTNGLGGVSMEFIRLPQTSNEKAEFVVLMNYYEIKDLDKYLTDANKESKRFLDRVEYLEIPQQNFRFEAYANKQDANGNDKSEDERPTVYIKWMKTFASIADAEAALTEANNWGDGTDAITLDENDSYGAAAATYSSVTLDRPLKADRWNTFCVPFDMSVDELGSVKELTGVENDGENYTLTFSDATSIVAGKPYIVKPTTDIETLSFENLALSDDAAGSTSVNNGYVTVTMYGNYDNCYVPEGAYFISNNKFYLADQADYVSQKAYRAFITIEGASAAKQLLINADGQATAISEALSSASDAKADVYSISGVRVAKGAGSLSTLPQGIYIVGGKKVIK